MLCSLLLSSSLKLSVFLNFTVFFMVMLCLIPITLQYSLNVCLSLSCSDDSALLKDFVENLDAMAEVSYLLEVVRGKTHSNWKNLGKAFNIPNRKLHSMTTLESDSGPTESLFRHLEASQPSLRVRNLVWALHQIERNDVNEKLEKYIAGQLNMIINYNHLMQPGDIFKLKAPSLP